MCLSLSLSQPTRQQMKTVENKNEEETVLFLFNGEPEQGLLCNFFYVYNKDSPFQPIFRAKTKNLLLIHTSIRKMYQKASFIV